MPFRKTAAVARLIQTSYFNLHSMIRTGRIPAPARDDSGHYVWSPEDVERARQALEAARQKRAARKPAEAVADAV